MSQDLLMSLLDMNPEELADRPEFKAWPTGTYKSQFKYEVVTDNTTVPYIKFDFKLLEVMEVAGGIEAPEINDKSRLVINAFPLKKEADADGNVKNAFGEGTIKLIAMGLKDTFPGNTMQILDGAQGATVAITIKATKQKNKDTGEIREGNELLALVVAD